jgi:citrate synthase
MLSTEEVARRLGVKPATVYAYVSRGLLSSRRNGDGKGSLFDPAEVDAFVAGRRAGPSPAAPAIHTGITLVRDGQLFFRGRDASVLAREQSFESVASLLWTGELDDVALVAPRELAALAAAVTAPLPSSARLTDRLRVIVAAAAAADPLRFDTTPAAVIATGRTMLATMVGALPVRAVAVRSVTERSLAAALWPRLTATPASPAGVAALNAALVLLADHDIAASTLAARVAASTRAHPYAVVGAGLAALDGPLHGAASGLAYELLTDAVRDGDPVRTISERLRVGGVIPGFGHHLYPDGDPRAMTLLEILRDSPAIEARGDGAQGKARGDGAQRKARGDGAQGKARGDGVQGKARDAMPRGGLVPGREQAVRATIDELAAAMARRPGVAPNVDFAIAAFALLYGMTPDAGEAIFAIARTAGWIAHALEEYGDRPNRFRPSGQYAGRVPGS